MYVFNFSVSGYLLYITIVEEIDCNNLYIYLLTVKNKVRLKIFGGIFLFIIIINILRN